MNYETQKLQATIISSKEWKPVIYQQMRVKVGLSAEWLNPQQFSNCLRLEYYERGGEERNGCHNGERKSLWSCQCH